jgi:phytoene dehydrogenase-like protein
MAPPGKSVLEVTLRTRYTYWETLRQDRQRYRAEKERVAEAVIAQLEPRFPGLKGQIEVIDVATPLTTHRYTGNKDAFDGLLAPDLSGLLRGRGLVRALPGLHDFYLVGQWAGFPGLPVVAGMGRSLIRFLRRRDGRPFIADVAD